MIRFNSNSETNALVLDEYNLPVDALPFIDSISTVQHKGAGAFAQFIQPVVLPGLLGTDAQFLFSPVLQTADQLFPNGVIKLANLTGRTLAGHIVGGIESYGPYNGLVTKNPSSVASKRLFEIWVTPGPSNVIPMPTPLPTVATPYPPAK